MCDCCVMCSVLEILRCIQLQQQSVVVDTAIHRLLNCNLSSKYAFTGKLCMSPLQLCVDFVCFLLFILSACFRVIFMQSVKTCFG